MLTDCSTRRLLVITSARRGVARTDMPCFRYRALLAGIGIVLVRVQSFRRAVLQDVVLIIYIYTTLIMIQPDSFHALLCAIT